MTSREQPYMSEIDKIMNPIMEPLMEKAVENFFANRQVHPAIMCTTQRYFRTATDQSETTKKSLEQDYSQKEFEKDTYEDVDKLKKSLIRNSDNTDISVGMIMRTGTIYVGDKRIK